MLGDRTPVWVLPFAARIGMGFKRLYPKSALIQGCQPARIYLHTCKFMRCQWCCDTPGLLWNQQHSNSKPAVVIARCPS